MNNKVNTTGKSLRKAALKSIIALVLCMATIIGGIGVGANTAYASGENPTLKVQFKGKTIDLLKDDEIKLSEVKKKWGKETKKKRDGSYTEYTWKKGKSSIKITDNGGGHCALTVDINDKNASVFGVKVGMKKAQAIKKIKKVSGLKIESHKDYLSISAGKDGGFYGYMPMSIGLKNSKVSSISFFHS